MFTQCTTGKVGLWRNLPSLETRRTAPEPTLFRFDIVTGTTKDRLLVLTPSTGVTMAQTIRITLTDDLDGSTATETVAFGLDDTSYELDLNAKNAAALRKTFERYLGAARKTTRSRTAKSRRGASAAASTSDPRAVRAWASSNKIKVSPRGRLSADVVAKFHSAGN